MDGRKSRCGVELFRLVKVKRLGILACCWAMLGMGWALAAIALNAASSAPVTIQVVNSSSAGLSILVTIPSFISGTHEDANGRFTTLALTGEGDLSDVGKPALPVILLLIMVPNIFGYQW